MNTYLFVYLAFFAPLCPLSISSLCVNQTAEFLKKLAVWQNQSYMVDGNTELIKSAPTYEYDLSTCPQ